VILAPARPLPFEEGESDDGGAEVLAESLIFAAPNGAFFGRKFSAIHGSKSQPKKRVPPAKTERFLSTWKSRQKMARVSPLLP
jgi:hypothetical protein